MRGTLRISCIGIVVPWIIPAYAGNTLSVSIVDAHLGDHPRVCGEHVDCGMIAVN